MSGAGARIFGGRWNPPEVVATIYVATTETGCRLELERLLASQARGSVSFPRQLHRLTLTDIVAVNLTSDAALDAVGLSPADVEDDDWSACQAVGNAVQYLGAQALRARSATCDGDISALYEPHLRPGQLALVATGEIPPSIATHVDGSTDE